MHRSQAAHHQISFSSTNSVELPAPLSSPPAAQRGRYLQRCFCALSFMCASGKLCGRRNPAVWLRRCRPPAFVPGRRSPPAAAPLAQGGAVPCLRRRIGRHRGLSLRPARQRGGGRARGGRGAGTVRGGLRGPGGGGTGAGCRAAPPRPSLTWPVPPSRVHPAAQPAFLGRGAVPERRRLRAEQQRVRRLPAAAVAERWARGVEAVVQQPAAQRAGGGGRCPRGGRGLRAELLPHGGGVSLPFVSRLSSGRARRSLRSRRPQLRAPGMRRPSARSPLPCGDGAGVVAAAARCRGAAAALRRERGAPGSRGPGTCGPRAGGSRRPSPPRGVAPRPRARPALHPEPLGQRSAPCPASRVPQRLGATRVTLSAAGLARFPYLGVPCAALLLVL